MEATSSSSSSSGGAEGITDAWLLDSAFPPSIPDEDDSVAEKEEEEEMDEGEIAVFKKSIGKSGSDGSP